MKKLFYIILLFILTICVGCQSNKVNNKVIDINGISMVPAKEMSKLLGLTYTSEDGGAVFGQDGITLKVK